MSYFQTGLGAGVVSKGFAATGGSRGIVYWSDGSTTTFDANTVDWNSIQPGAVKGVVAPNHVSIPPSGVAWSSDPAPAPTGAPVAVTVITVIPMGISGSQIIYSDGSTAFWPPNVSPPAIGSVKTAPPASPANPPENPAPNPSEGPLVTVGATFHYEGYAIIIQSVGAGGPGGLMTDEHVQLPIGTVYKDTVDGSIWKTTGPNSATQIVKTPPVDAGTPPIPPSGIIVNSDPGVVAAPVASWFTDPAQEMISGFPNWMLLVGAGAAFLVLKKK